MRIESRGNHVEIILAIEEDHSLPSLEAAYLALEFSSHGFSGSNELWVASADLVAFCQALVALARDGRGEAVLAAKDPRELELRIRPAGDGLLAIEGRTGYAIGTGHGDFWHEARFGFEFEPWQLAAAIRLPWVRTHAAWEGVPAGGARLA